ncbi:MAG: AAA family ATPase, partial [Cytophagales bacterium]|nr:AAA family ATPase [Cytophagales bacterium]
PIGIQTFSDIIQGDFVYVDKTRYIEELVKLRYVFLSRPRRFGKSLLVDTLKCLFEGKKELFQGLYIYDKWDWNTKYPVIRIDLSKTKYMNTEQLVQKLIFLLEQLYAYHGIPFEKDMPAFNSFDNLIQKVCQKYGQKVVILIDEYDKPIIDCLTEVEIAKANRTLLRSVYSV